MFVLALTTAIAGVFFGGALYVNLVEHPSRVACGTPAAVRQFREMYPRAAAMMGSLSALGCMMGLVAAWLLRDVHIAVNAIILGFPVPFTLIVIAPVNRALMDPALDASSERATELLARWLRLHTVRTILGGMAFGLMLFRLVIHGSAGAA
ncbi:MAG TPA: DUF1772 domain-containing protein [Candidatus Polarisedimenticolia bacterium]|nr:DUF1772 domain-containing protein [Candidatus Polarisedimenticolia bacterium]